MEMSFVRHNMELLLCLIFAVGFVSSSLIVESPAGTFQGLEETATNKQTYVVFRGIPYAKPPVGELRFAKPEPHPKIDTVFDATKPMVVCPQPAGLDFSDENEVVQEDCLVLNIFAKEVNRDQKPKKKVLVFIHGGGFVVGSARYYETGQFVAEQDLIVVAINYRIGILGFLSTENEASPGNYGMWDQTLALKWVKENIASFGGDPDDIAITGESAGGASVALLSISPATKGLFTKAHPMSGTATAIFSRAMDPQLGTLELAKSASCWDGDIDKKVGVSESMAIVKCLRERPLSDLTSFNVFKINKFQFVPCVDGDFMPDVQGKLMKDEKYLESIGFFQRSYLFGMDNNERAIWEGPVDAVETYIMQLEDITDEEKSAMLAGLMTSAWQLYVKSRLNIEDPSETLVSKVRDWYDRRVGNLSAADMMSDLSFTVPTYDFLDALSRRKSKNVYFFYFNHYPAFMKGTFRGIPHAMDLVYWTDLTPLQMDKYLRVGVEGDFNKEDLQLGSMLSSMIADFVRTGNPYGSVLKAKMPSGWPAYDTDNGYYLDFNPEPRVRQHLEEEKKKLWFQTIPQWASELGHRPVHTEL